ncbi:MAG: hypothetical protein HY795_15420 [Desulfovibrio sp.]|nr:hypothetical protein [Desulfovibrio sp.]MBI4958787.1 hypothetical protein [Desulfovibrio sp.]
MRATLFLAALLAAAASADSARAQVIGPVDPGAQVDVSSSKSVTINGVTGVGVRTTTGVSQGYMVPDDRGGYVYYAPGSPLAQPKPARADAEEIRLYARELASQITRGISGDAPLYGVSSIPSAFVNQDTRETTSFGRLMGEQMIYELNSRGFPVKEARGAAPAKAKGKKAPAEALAVLAGSYYVDKDNLFVNARLVEPSGRVLRTGSVLIPMTPTLRRMLGIPDYNGLRPTPPTLIGSRNSDDPPGSGDKTPMPYSPSAKKKAPAKKSTKTASKSPCPPGCEPIDTAAKSATQQPAAKPDQK